MREEDDFDASETTMNDYVLEWYERLILKLIPHSNSFASDEEEDTLFEQLIYSCSEESTHASILIENEYLHYNFVNMFKRFVSSKIENMSSRLLLTKPTLTSVLKVCKQKLEIF